MKVLINLYYHNNVTRKYIKTLEYFYDEQTKIQNLKETLTNIIKDCTEFSVDNVKIGLKTKIDRIFIPNDEEKLIDVIKDSLIDIFIMNILAPQSANTVYDIDGMTFFFHSNEKKHLPHIHVAYSGNEISVLLAPPFEYKGNMNKSKLKKAMNYIKEHCDELVELFWDLTNAGNSDE